MPNTTKTETSPNQLAAYLAQREAALRKQADALQRTRETLERIGKSEKRAA